MVEEQNKKVIIKDFEVRREYKEIQHINGTKYIDGNNYTSWLRSIEVLTLKPENIVEVNDDIKAFAKETQDKFKALFDTRNNKISDGQVKFSYDATLAIIGNLKNPDRINIIPAKAGFGKSSYIYSFLSVLCKHIHSGDFSNFSKQGAIIVTDKIEVLRKLEKDIINDQGYYYKKDKFPVTNYTYILEAWNKNSFKEGICKNEAIESYEYGMCSPFECPFYNECKMSYQKYQQAYSPILLMTNARFKQYGDRIDDYSTWIDKSGNKHDREIIIIDEKPEIIDNYRIDTKLFADMKQTVEKINHNGIDMSDVKRYLLNEILQIENEVLQLRSEVSKYRNCICSGTKEEVFTEKFKTQWVEYIGFEGMAAINAIEKMFIQGALWCNATIPFFKTLGIKDFNYEGFKTYIFDATAELDPDYEDDRFQFLDIEDYKNYENVTFHIFRDEAMNMSKSALNPKKHFWKNVAVAEWIRNNFKDKTYVVSYMDNVAIISKHLKLKPRGEEEVIILDQGEDKPLIPHFGDTKGSNEFKDAKYMVQIGWNRAPSDEYLAQCLSRNTNLDKVFEKKENHEERTAKLLENEYGKFTSYDEANVYMWRKMAVEFEQEVFRTCVRDFSADNAVEIYIFNPDRKVIGLISQRFKNCKFKSTYDVPIEFQEEKILGRNNSDGTDNKIQAFIKWLRKEWDGSEISIKEMKSKFEMSDKYWEKVRANEVVKEIKDNRKVQSRRKGKGASQVTYWYISE